MYTNDERFAILHTPGSNTWTLQIKFVQRRDHGLYECQVRSCVCVCVRMQFLFIYHRYIHIMLFIFLPLYLNTHIILSASAIANSLSLPSQLPS